MPIKPKCSIVVCTNNRCHQLTNCFSSIVNQSDKNFFEIIVVDNNSSDATREIVTKFKDNNANIRYVFDSNIGLSNARNTGWKIADSDWIFYLDDDAELSTDTLTHIINNIESSTYDIVGGIFYPKYIVTKPKWFPDKYGSNSILLEVDDKEIGVHYFACGGVLLCRKKVLESVGGFHSGIGMSGRVMGYGEETLMQIQAKKLGFKIGIDKNIQVLHTVQPYKYSLMWQLRSAYVTGKDQFYFNKSKNLGVYWTIKKFIIIMKNAHKNNLNTRENKYWQNVFLAYALPLAHFVGELRSTKHL